MFQLLALIGAGLGIVAIIHADRLRKSVIQLQTEIKFLQERLERTGALPPATDSSPQQRAPADTREDQDSTTSPKAPPQSAEPATGRASPQLAPRPSTQEPHKPDWHHLLIDNWMTWLGGISVALAGVFMVRYSMAMGLLGPGMQISLALLTGLILHGIAYWLRHRNGAGDPIFASLAGGASITLYAALLASLHVYHLADARLIFVALAIVSLLTVALALLHGPMLAMLGLVGAYIVPLLVGANSGDITAAMLYSLVISSAGLLLLRYVFRPWLWWSVTIGGLDWWALSLGNADADVFRGPYLALLAWCMLAIPGFDWTLRSSRHNAAKRLAAPVFRHGDWTLSPLQIALFAIVIAWGLSMVDMGHSGLVFLLWAPLVVVCFMAGHRHDFAAYAWLTLAVQWLAWLWQGVTQHSSGARFSIMPLPDIIQEPFMHYALAMTALYCGGAAWQWYRHGATHLRASLALLAPLAWLALAYLQINGVAGSMNWSFGAIFIGMVYGLWAAMALNRGDRKTAVVWLILAGHLAYSLAVTLYFREASLSLALAAQLVSLSWLMRRFELPWLSLFIKAILAVVVLRLSLNPWLLQYPQDIHWSLWTYGGATAFAFIASRLCDRESNLRSWLEAASLQLLVMTLGTELRYWLYDGDIFASRYNLTEAAINTSLWSALGCVYYYRARFSNSIARIYRFFAYVLIAMALASYVIAITVHNPLWTYSYEAKLVMFTKLLLAYGLPVLAALGVAAIFAKPVRRFALVFAGLSAFLYINLLIRWACQDTSVSLSHRTGDGELYTYSVVWMLIAITCILAGTRWTLPRLYQSGMWLLGIVIAKIFLVDMAGLDGLWRVAAFMGLGLSLLALAWFYRRMKSVPVTPEFSKDLPR